jgi:hypothetical protein
VRCAIAVAILAIAADAAAAPEVSDDDMAKAKARFERGKASYEAKDYKTAIEQYIAAYKIAPFPELVFNIGQAYRLAGKDARALEAYEMYLQQQPEGEVAYEVRGHVLDFKSRGVTASDELRRTKPGDAWSALDERIAERADADAASLRHRGRRFFVGGSVLSHGIAGGVEGTQLTAVGGLYHRLNRYAAVQPRAALGVLVTDEEQGSNALRFEATARLLAYPRPWIFVGGGLGLGVSSCKDIPNDPFATAPTLCESGVYATLSFEVGVLISDRYEVGVQLYPAWMLEELDVYDTGRIRPGIGLTFSYHL